MNKTVISMVTTSNFIRTLAWLGILNYKINEHYTVDIKLKHYWAKNYANYKG